MSRCVTEDVEEWRPVVGHPGYEVSSLGRVRSIPMQITQLSRWGTDFTRVVGGKLLKAGIASNGYWTVAIGKDNTRTVHSLVAEAFIGPCLPGEEVRHKNGNRLDPVLTNLHYGTRTDNILDAIEHGTWYSEKRIAGWARQWESRV